MAPVHEAALKNDVEGLRAMLDAEPGLIEAEDETSSNCRPLHYACSRGHMEAVRLLLDGGASIDPKDLLGITPLMDACEAGCLEVAVLLLSRGANPALCSCLRWTALTFAAMAGGGAESSYVAMVQILIRDGRVPINAQDFQGCTALWHACDSGKADTARVLLLEGGADHTIRGGLNALTPKSAASKKGHRDCSRLLDVSQ